MKYIMHTKDINLRINIDGGLLSFKDKFSNSDVEIVLSESDMKYLKERTKLISED